MSISQPCTSSKIVTTINAVAAVFNGVYGILGIATSDTFGRADQSNAEEALMYRAIGSLIWSPIQAISAVKGLNRVKDCRAFNVRLSEEQRRGAQAQATYNWLDEFSPAPELGVAPQNLPAIIPPVRGFSPVFSGSISNSPEQ